MNENDKKESTRCDSATLHARLCAKAQAVVDKAAARHRAVAAFETDYAVTLEALGLACSIEVTAMGVTLIVRQRHPFVDRLCSVTALADGYWEYADNFSAYAALDEEKARERFENALVERMVEKARTRAAAERMVEKARTRAAEVKERK